MPDMAVLRASIAGAKVVLASATPSLETGPMQNRENILRCTDRPLWAFDPANN